MSHSTFEVDKKGMSQIYGDRPLDRAVLELLSNAMDEQATQIEVTIEQVERGRYRIRVEDNSPEGFKDLSHAYTLFASSYKKSDPAKRGRFNFGEKSVIAVCKEASIVTTTGGVRFDDGGRHGLRQKTDSGTVFEAIIRANRGQFEDAVARLKRIIPDEGVAVTVNGVPIPPRKPIVSFEESLPTVISDEDGVLRPTVRKTFVNVFEVLPDERAQIFEMGIPVVETYDLYHYDIRQKVPLSMDRDNVTPSYLKKVRTAVLNHTASEMPEDETDTTWVNEAMEDASEEALKTTITKRFGKDVAIADPSDREAENRLKAQGYTIIPSRSFNKNVWDNIRKTRAADSAGRISPTPPHSHTSINGVEMECEPVRERTAGMLKVEAYAKMVARHCLGVDISVHFTGDPKFPHLAWYGRGSHRLTFNVFRLGKGWFNRPPAITWEIENLLIHELAHEKGSHLEEKFDDALSEIGAKLSCLKYTKSELFSEFKN